MDDTLEMKQEELLQVAMQIIMHAGDARLRINEALKAAKVFDFEQADSKMKEAVDEITEAHRAQTKVIQREAGGDAYPYTLIFTHAQDTIMTINSEVRLAEEMIDILKLLEERTRQVK